MTLQLKKILSFAIFVGLIFTNTTNVFAQICAASGCAFDASFDATDITFMETGSGPAGIDLSTNIDYVAMEGVDPPSNCGAPYLNGYDVDAGGSAVLMTFNTPIAITGGTALDYCFFFYNYSNIAAPTYGNYPIDIAFTTDAGTISTSYSPTAAELAALQNQEWVYMCVPFTPQGAATQLLSVNQELEFETSADGRCTDAGGGYSVGNTCEVFGIAPDGITTCPVVFAVTCDPVPAPACGLTTVTECKTVADLIGPDRNQFPYTLVPQQPSEGYLHNFEVPNPSSCGTPTVTSAVIEVDITTIDFPNGDPAACPFYSVFANVYTLGAGVAAPLSPAPLAFPVEDINTPGCGAFGGTALNASGTFQCEDIVDNCGQVVEPCGTVGIDLVPAFAWNAADPFCDANINGQAITTGNIDVTYEVCITYTFDNVIPEVTTTVDDNATICDGDLTTEIADWQADIDASAEVAAAVTCGATIVYSTEAVPAEAMMPNGSIADGVHSGMDNCATETQTTYAYINCPAGPGLCDVAAGYTLVGTHTLTIYPDFDASLLTATVGDCATAPALVAATCPNYTVSLDGDGDDISAAPTAGQCGTNNYSISWTGAPSCWTAAAQTVDYGCVDASFTCPSNVPKCDGNVALMPVDGTGTWSGTGAPYVDSNTNELDPAICPTGVLLTLTYTVSGPGCEESVTCTFQVIENCDAEGGKF